MKTILIKLIELYQVSLSPDHGWMRSRYPYGFCRHYPSCSEYSKQAIEKHGALYGGYLAFLRILRCNPYARPKFDPVK